MKLYNKEGIYQKRLTYEQALKEAKNGNIISRQEWDGVHMFRDNRYYIITKHGSIIVNPFNIEHTDKNDWVLVVPNQECLRIMSMHGMLSKNEIDLLYRAYQTCLSCYQKCYDKSMRDQRGF